jgi:hypothetical protein
MLQKRERPKQSIHTWQVKSIPKAGHRGVVDKKPASDFQSNPRKEVQCRAQKSWYNPAVSDFADEAEVVGVQRRIGNGRADCGRNHCGGVQLNVVVCPTRTRKRTTVPRTAMKRAAR